MIHENTPQFAILNPDNYVDAAEKWAEINDRPAPTFPEVTGMIDEINGDIANGDAIARLSRLVLASDSLGTLAYVAATLDAEFVED